MCDTHSENNIERREEYIDPYYQMSFFSKFITKQCPQNMLNHIPDHIS